MKKIWIFLIIILGLACLYGCQDRDNIISLVDSPEGYQKIDVIKTQYPNGEIRNIYKNDNKYVFHIVSHKGYAGDVEIAFLIMDDEIKAMKGYKIKETKGYGTRAFEENYLNQFIGINLKGKEQLRGGSKPSQDIDIIYVTGATRTSKAVVIAFNILIEYYNDYLTY
ncbi:MAG: FMN-binding protein [Bacillota bacterium]|jgi:electron transport complex protein RnfG|nr:FMN-binding protein [Bacillota bacterium]HHU42796.1 FMN-binding protein [Clostridiales bacterium]